MDIIKELNTLSDNQLSELEIRLKITSDIGNKKLLYSNRKKKID